MGPAAGSGVKAPVPRTRTGCLTCRKRKVKCDEVHPVCSRCQRLQRTCVWADDLQVIQHRRQHATGNSSGLDFNLGLGLGQNFVIELPNVDRATVPYIHHFMTFCTRFLAYSNDNEGNPFQEELFPLASSSPALLHSMAALAAGHLARTQRQSTYAAANYYSRALKELNATLSDPIIARSDSTLGACLLLCVYEISHSDSCLWLEHLQGARDLILFRGGPRSTEYLTRFFSFLDISGSLSSGGGPLLQGNYWLEDGPTSNSSVTARSTTWPFYDKTGLMVNHFHALMVFMAKLAQLSAESQSDLGYQYPEIITANARQIYSDLRAWWNTCPPELRDQSNDWRRQSRPQKLTVAETLEEESLSSTKSVMQGCIIYVHHILDPLSQEPQKQEVIDAVADILEIAKECPPGFGLEMGLYWSLFMAGTTILNDDVAEDLIRQKLSADTSLSIYHADRALELLEYLWKLQHETGCKYDWRRVQAQMGIQIFVLA